MTDHATRGERLYGVAYRQRQKRVDRIAVMTCHALCAVIGAAAVVALYFSGALAGA